MTSIVRGKKVLVPKYFVNLEGSFKFDTENVSSCFTFNIVEEKFLQLSLEMKGFTFLLNQEDFDYSEIYQNISSSSENIKKFTKESNLMINVINQTYQSFHEKYENIVETASTFNALREKIKIFTEKTFELAPKSGFEHCVEDFTDCDLIEESYQIMNDFKSFGIEIQFDQKTITAELHYSPDFNFASQKLIDEKNRKSFKNSPIQVYKERKKYIPRLKKLSEKFQDSLKLIQHTDEEWSIFMKESLDFFTGIFQTMLNNLSFLPPIDFQPVDSLKISEYPSYLKKRILLISISITDTLKSHKILHAHDTLKKEKEKLEEENKQMKKLLKIVMLRGALEKSIFQIKADSEMESLEKANKIQELRNVIEEDNKAAVDQKKPQEEIKKIEKLIKEMEKAKTLISMRSQSTQVLEYLKENEKLDKYWIKEESNITPDEKKKLRKLLPQLYQRLSEVIHRPDILCFDLHFPLFIEPQDISNSYDLMIVLKEILETHNCNVDESGEKFFNFK
jgi:hypothetical protein